MGAKPGQTRRVEWNGIPVDAAAPVPLSEWEPRLSLGTVRRTEQAAAAVQRFGDRALGAAEVAARLLLRAEGLASSEIEGIRAPAVDVALAEAVAGQDGPARPAADRAPSATGSRRAPSAIESRRAPSAAGSRRGPATGSRRGPATGAADNQVAPWVADNLAVIGEALATPPPLAVGDLLAWHERLMRNAGWMEPRHVGAWRDTLGWIGGPNPRLAVHVAAPAEDIPALMADLVGFVARDDVDPVTSAAVAHAQFETIHPFADGNGRIGRVLVGWILRQRLAVPYPPPVSLQMARDVGGYQAGLTLYRQDQVDVWVAWFADAIVAAAAVSGEVLARVVEVQGDWRGRVADLRIDAAARRLCEELLTHPVVSALTAGELLGVSRQAAATAITALEARGILVPLDTPAPGRNARERWWAAKELLDLLGTR